METFIVQVVGNFEVQCFTFAAGVSTILRVVKIFGIKLLFGMIVTFEC